MRAWRRLSSVLILLFFLVGALPGYAEAQKKSGGKSTAATKAKPKGSDKTVSVREYTRKDGTKVRAHTRRPPGSATDASSSSSGSSEAAASSSSRSNSDAATTPRAPAAVSAASTESTYGKPDATRAEVEAAGPIGAADAAGHDGGLTLSVAAPVFLMPDTNRTPLRLLPANTRIRVLDADENWVRGEFKDPQFGTRVGYIEKRHVRADRQN